MKEKKQLSIMRVFVFAIMIALICISTTIKTKEDELIAYEELPYYEGKYNSINYVANLLDSFSKDNVLISPFNINSTLSGLYNYDEEVANYFQDTKENVANNYLSKMTKYKKGLKNKTKKEAFYEKCIQKFYNKQYDTITIKSLSKIGNIEKKEIIELLDTIILASESLTNKNIKEQRQKVFHNFATLMHN